MDLEAPTVEWERRCCEFVNALEEERQKIQIFQRELPLSLHLVTQTIESYRHHMAAQLLGAVGVPRSELEEEMSREGAPVLEEFIPMKRSPSSKAEGNEEAGDPPHRDLQHSCNGGRNDEDNNSTRKQKPHETSGKKPNWLISVQLWNQGADPQPLPEDDDDDVDTRQRPIVVDARKATGAFLPFHPQERQSPSPAALIPSEVAPDPARLPPVPVTSSTCDTRRGRGGGGKGGCGGGDGKDGQLHRKARRCWSPEMHRRFLSALQQLGGSDVATPKRIRELMRVDGMTNDEVKSHLQKYRLHSRRPSPTARGNASNPPPQQVVLVGGIWVPPQLVPHAASTPLWLRCWCRNNSSRRRRTRGGAPAARCPERGDGAERRIVVLRTATPPVPTLPPPRPRPTRPRRLPGNVDRIRGEVVPHVCTVLAVPETTGEPSPGSLHR